MMSIENPELSPLNRDSQPSLFLTYYQTAYIEVNQNTGMLMRNITMCNKDPSKVL